MGPLCRGANTAPRGVSIACCTKPFSSRGRSGNVCISDGVTSLLPTMRWKGDFQLGDFSCKTSIGICIAPMGHVTRDDFERGIAMLGVDRLDRLAQPFARVLAVKRTVANHMGICQVDELHSAASGLAQSSHPVPVEKTGPSHVNGMSWITVMSSPASMIAKEGAMGPPCSNSVSVKSGRD